MNSQFGVDAKGAGADPGELNHDQLADAAAGAVTARYEEKEKQFGGELMRWLEVDGTNPDVDTPADLAGLRAAPGDEP